MLIEGFDIKKTTNSSPW